MNKGAIPWYLVLILVVGVQSCQRECVVEGSRVEEILKIGCVFRSKETVTMSFTFYPSGFIHAQYFEMLNRPPLKDGWHEVEDLAAYQRLFDRAKEAVRSCPSAAPHANHTAEVTFGVETDAARYNFDEDILGLRTSAFPACHPFPKDAHGHSREWIAVESFSVIDGLIRR